MLSRLFCLLAFVLVAVPGCGDGGAEVSKKQFALLGDLRETLAKVTDAATLKTQLPKLEELSQQLAAAQAELNKQQISTEQQRDIRQNQGKDLVTLIKELGEQADRIDKLPNVDEKDLGRLVVAITAASAGTAP